MNPPSFHRLFELIFSFIDDLMTKDQQMEQKTKDQWFSLRAFLLKTSLDPISLQAFIKDLNRKDAKALHSLHSPVTREYHVNLPYLNESTSYKQNFQLEIKKTESATVKAESAKVKTEGIEFFSPSKKILSKNSNPFTTISETDSPSLIKFQRKDLFPAPKQRNNVKPGRFKFSLNLIEKVREFQSFMAQNSEKIQKITAVCHETLSPRAKPNFTHQWKASPMKT